MENTFIYLVLALIILMTVYLFKNKLLEYFLETPVLIAPSIFYNKVEEGYDTLINSLYHNSNKKDLKKNIHNIIHQRADGRYVGGYSKKSHEFDFISFSLDSFYDLVRYDEKKNENFILEINENSSLLQLNDFLKKSLDDKVNVKSFLSSNAEKGLFPYKNILLNYQKELNKNKIQLGFFSDALNSYYLLLFPLSKEETVHHAVSDIGFKYMREIAVS